MKTTQPRRSPPLALPRCLPRGVLVLALGLGSAALVSGCVSKEEHRAFVKAASDYRLAVASVVSSHAFLTEQAKVNWYQTDEDFGRAIEAAQKRTQ